MILGVYGKTYKIRVVEALKIGLDFNAQVRAWSELRLFAVKVATIGWP